MLDLKELSAVCAFIAAVGVALDLVTLRGCAYDLVIRLYLWLDELHLVEFHREIAMTIVSLGRNLFGPRLLSPRGLLVSAICSFALTNLAWLIGNAHQTERLVADLFLNAYLEESLITTALLIVNFLFALAIAAISFASLGSIIRCSGWKALIAVLLNISHAFILSAIGLGLAYIVFSSLGGTRLGFFDWVRQAPLSVWLFASAAFLPVLACSILVLVVLAGWAALRIGRSLLIYYTRVVSEECDPAKSQPWKILAAFVCIFIIALNLLIWCVTVL